MTACSRCITEMPEGAKFCFNCGFPVTQSGSPSDFDLGKLAALASIKDDVLKWLRGWGVGIGLIAAVLAYFGTKELIKTTVSERVQTELKQNRDQITKSMRDVFIDVGKASANQEQIDKILTTTKTKLQATEEDRRLLEGKIQETLSKRDKLLEIIDNLNVASFINKLKYDFYHVKDFSGNFNISIKPQKNYLLNDLKISVDLYKRLPNGYYTTVAQLTNDQVTYMTAGAAVDGMKGRLALFAPWDDEILNRNISEFENIESAKFTLMIAAPNRVKPESLSEQRELIKQLKEHLKYFTKNLTGLSAKITLNRALAWSFNADLTESIEDESSDRGYTVSFMAAIEPATKPFVTMYDEAFQDKVPPTK